MNNNSNDKKFFNIIKIINDKYYANWVEHLKEKILYTSRQKDLYEDPLNLIFIQFKLVESISNIEKAIKKGKLKNKNKNSDLSYDYSIFLHKQLARIIKVIADGIAWRVLGFDRPFLRIMSEEIRYPSSVQLSTHDFKNTQIEAFKLVLRNDSKVLLNDITNYLRFGDLLEIKGNETIIHELKKSGKKVINLNKIYEQIKSNPKAKISKQIRKLVAAQIARNKRVIITNKSSIKILDLDIEFTNNLKDIEDLINVSKKNLYSSREFGNYLRVSCFNILKLAKNVKKWKKYIDVDIKGANKFKKDEIVLPISNFNTYYDEKGNFARNSTPYSIYPFKIDDCMSLLDGEYYLLSLINYSEIKRLFNKKGWEIVSRDKNFEQVAKENKKIIPNLFDGEIFQKRIDEIYFRLKRNNFFIDVPLTYIIRIGTDFLKPEVLLNAYETIYKQSKPGVESLFVFYILGEKKVWV